MRAVTFLSLASLAAAQTTYLGFELDTSDVDAVTLSSWCVAQRNTCQSLCTGRPDENTCDDTELTYSCQCTNGTEPGLQYYEQSLYSLICAESYNQCTFLNAGDLTELTNCETEIRDDCGTLAVEVAEEDDDDDTEETATTTTEESAATETAEEDADSTDDEGAAAMTFPDKAAAAVLAIGLAAILV